MNNSSTKEDRLRIYAWIWEACIAFDYKNEQSRVEKEIKDMEKLRVFIVDNKNASLLIAFWKLQIIYKRLGMGIKILQTLTDFQFLTLDLLEDSNLHSENNVVTTLLCFHHYCVLMLFEAERKYNVDILLPSLPLSQENWEKIKMVFKFKDDTFREDIIETTGEFIKCKNDMEGRESDEKMFQSCFSSILSRLENFCHHLRKLLSTPTVALVMIFKKDIADSCYKCFKIPNSELIVREIKEHGVTKDSIGVILDLLLLKPKPQEDELKPVVLDATSPEKLCNTLRITRVFDKKKANDDSVSEKPSAESKRIVQKIQVKGDSESFPKSLSVIDTQLQVEKCSEILSEFICAIKTLPQMVNEKNLEIKSFLVDDLVKDVKEVLEMAKNLRAASNRVADACSEHEKACKKFLESITNVSKKNKPFFQFINIESLCEVAKNAIEYLKSGKGEEPESKIMNSTFIAENINTKDISRYSDLSMPVLMPQVSLDTSQLDGSFDKDSMPSLSPQKIPVGNRSSPLTSTQKLVPTNSTPCDRSSDSGTSEEINLYKRSFMMTDDELTKTKFSTHSSTQNMSDSVLLSSKTSTVKENRKGQSSQHNVSETGTCESVVLIEQENEVFDLHSTLQSDEKNVSIWSKKNFVLNEVAEQRTINLSPQSTPRNKITSVETVSDELESDKKEATEQRICGISSRRRRRNGSGVTKRKKRNVNLTSNSDLNPRVLLKPLKDATSDRLKINKAADKDDDQPLGQAHKETAMENVETKCKPDTTLGPNKPQKESPDYDINKLFKRRRRMIKCDSSYSEEEI